MADHPSDQTAAPAPAVAVLDMASLGVLKNYLRQHHSDAVKKRFPDGQIDIFLFAAELLARLEGRPL